MAKTIEVIKTEFVPITVKAHMAKKLEEGDKEMINKVISELDRLESIIRDYEMVFEQVNRRQESTTFKTSAL